MLVTFRNRGSRRLTIAIALAASVFAVNERYLYAREEAGAPRATSTLADIDRGIKHAFAEISENTLTLDYRVERSVDERVMGRGVVRHESLALIMRLSSHQLYGHYEAEFSESNHNRTVAVRESSFDGTTGRDWIDGSAAIRNRDGGAYYNDSFLETIGFPLRPRDKEEAEKSADILYWIPFCFRKRDYRVGARQEQVDGEWCHVVEMGTRDKMWVDVPHGFAIRKRLLRDESRTGTLSEIAIAISDLKRISNRLWLPQRLSRERRLLASDSKMPRKSVFSERITIARVELPKEFPIGRIQFAFPNGTLVHDEIRGGTSRVTPTGIETIDESLRKVQNMSGDTRRNWLALLGSFAAIFIAVIASSQMFIRVHRSRRFESTAD